MPTGQFALDAASGAFADQVSDFAEQAAFKKSAPAGLLFLAFVAHHRLNAKEWSPARGQ